MPELQPYEFACVIAKTSVESPPVTSTAPSASNPRALRSRLSPSSSGAAIAAPTATGRLMKKIHSQLRTSVKTPPRSTPAAAPKPPTAPQTPSAMFRSRPSENVVIRIESAAGEMIAAPRPWIERAPISDASLHARPASSEPIAKTARPDDEHAATTEHVGGAAAEQQEPAEDERVRADHPLQVLLRETEIHLDRRQRDIHDRDVEHHHELDDAEESESPPLAS